MKYQHYKGGIYEIVCEARLEANPDVLLVIYRSVPEGAVWARPKEMFFELVKYQGRDVARFSPVD
ncbi:MAG: hypothetical protein A2522_08790 [Gallionellales bacterium RIFOXYD12_FULL_53_10]|jgi:hypothetical protein|nr:DUF1653 domain-containing protein [Gallionella sp.]OGS68914.1 MAG: hypothetical protein A2Z87_00135 [Gallionellales bacterium GWA2_54_124]OGT17963.1 MAG: hypothetical protein A2522_08790 [Gallionellales bacterium RIFOXYD12_FULL_53_10]OGT25001.1 MAG: hypothetical protein A3K00_03330 [Gallionellales bacterium RIFOXYD2_FULL_52_7]